ncbi:MAG: DNA-binding response regulator [Chloroflexi bacterium]|nr:MAG: DNA-binding response regulator [Chloroflexota bacterium]MBL1194089.1 DNA-binding response regulator [Chloroflexota bacterium]NOH11383.1 response regulator transcription factor [Chloroflexota bacterium]
MPTKILIVDDEEAARKSLSDILRLEGYHVASKANGADAVEALELEDFDLMLLDLKMPGMDGLEVLDRASDLAPNTKVIMLTAHGSLESAIEALRQGAHDYLLKPASPEDIINSVSKGVSQRNETARKRRLIERMEASLNELKDAEGVEISTEPPRAVFTLGESIQVDLERRELWQGETNVSLTPTEGKLMQVLMENRSKVLSHRELVLLVQGYQTTDWEAPEIMRPLVSRLRRKLASFEGGDDWIVNVRGTGYVFDGA